MQKTRQNTTLLGDFNIAQDKQVRGTLTIGSSGNALYAWEKEPFTMGEDPLTPMNIFSTITGDLENGDKASLIGCESPVFPIPPSFIARKRLLENITYSHSI